MKKRILIQNLISKFKENLTENEKSRHTIEKYMRDIKGFMIFAGSQKIDKGLMLEYKAKLESEYAVTSANSMLASVNSLFRFLGWYECIVKQFKVQKKTYCSEEKELTKGEYKALVEASKKEGNERLSLLIQTICTTGIRVSELQYITLESLKKSEAVVSCKSKTRTVFIVPHLCKKLIKYAEKQGITKGAIFITKSGKPMNRCNVWREMKNLCVSAGVNPKKVFPHNLRHLFARTFYSLEKDIAKLADILGHTSINTTRIYIMSTGAEHRKKLEKMRLVI